MPYYLSDPVERIIGPHKLRFPRGHDIPGANFVWLGQRAILWTPDNIADQRLTKIGLDGDERAAQATVRAFQLVADTRDFKTDISLSEIVADLLLRPPAGKWNPLKPSFRRGRYEIILGPKKLLWAQAAPRLRHSVQYVDNFNRANGDLDGSTSSDGQFTWTEINAENLFNFAIQSNQLVSINQTNNTFVIGLTDEDTDSADQLIQVSIPSLSRAANTTLLAEIAGRMNEDGTNGYAFGYGWDFFGSPSSPVSYMYRYSDETGIGSQSSTPVGITANDILSLECDGSSITGYVNGVEKWAATDTTEATGPGNRRAYVGVYSSFTSSNDIAFDDFMYQDLDFGASGPAFAGTVSSQSSSIAGVGSPRVAATGTLSSQASALAGIVRPIITATGALASLAADILGTLNTPAVFGNVQAQNSALSGIISVEQVLSGALDSGNSAISGAIRPIASLQGALASGNSSLSGSISVVIELQGSLVSAVAAISGDGTVILANIFTGVLQSQAAAMAGTGSSSIAMEGAMRSSAATILGEFRRAKIDRSEVYVRWLDRKRFRFRVKSI